MLLAVKPIMKAATASMVENICENGPLGISVGWWHFIGVLAIPIMTVLSLGVYGLRVHGQIRRGGRYPSANGRPLVDAELFTGDSAKKFAKKNLFAALTSFVLTIVVLCLLVDVTRQFGLNLEPTKQTECREGIQKRK